MKHGPTRQSVNGRGRGRRIALVLLLAGSVGVAGQPGSTAERTDSRYDVAQASQAPGQARPPAQKRPAKPAAPAAPAAPAGDGGLRQRIEQIEEQLVDIQVVLGTLQSLAQGQRGGPPQASQPLSGGGGGEDPRIAVMETQIRALTLQVERLQAGARGVNGRRSEVEPSREEPVRGPARSDEPQRGRAVAGGFGTTQVVPAGRDPIGGLLGSQGVSREPAPPPASVPPRTTLAPLAGQGSPKDSYETAYGYLLQQNYGAAEAAFADFLERYPSHGLAGNAQYWLGETHFVRGDYKAAAAAFLKGYQAHAKSAKAPDSLLKLAVSLERLGERESACATFSELTARYPRAPQHVLAKAETEVRRAGC